MSEEPNGLMPEVTKAEFYAAIGPLDVHPRSGRTQTIWEDRHRRVIGKESTGYASGHHERTRYFLATTLKPEDEG